MHFPIIAYKLVVFHRKSRYNYSQDRDNIGVRKRGCGMKKRTILIVDDEIVNRKILGKLLEDQYELLYACDGKEALEILSMHTDSISVVILDIIMPIMNGYDVLSEMQKDEKMSKIPVIVSSQKDNDEDEIKALVLGAQDFIAKPYKVDIIRHRLENIIKLRETAAIVNKTQKDELTGLYNKQFFIQKVQELLGDNADERYDLLCIGVERFKLINDTYGIRHGDRVLQHIANLLGEVCREVPICGRFGADSFYAVLPHKDTYSNEMFLPWFQKVNEYPVGMDIKLHCGIYMIHDSSVPVAAMCDRAQLAADKNRGKYDACFDIYDESLREKLIEEQYIVSSMQTALKENQFHVFYQPKYSLHTEEIVGAEALVRWIHPEKGCLSPGIFIPLFEKNGFITQLDIFVWETVCKDIRAWMDLGYPPVAISVNVSRADIYNPKLTDILLGFIEKYKVPMPYLHLEITESAYTEDPTQIIAVVGRLRELGFVIEMDDFGSGYSSLNMLADMPVDVLKLDMGFIQSETGKTSGKGILSFVISMAKWLDLAVVAEGVETEEQITVLRSMDCNYVQGFYFAKPMEKNRFQELIQTAGTTEMICTSRRMSDCRIDKKGREALEHGRVMLVVDDIEINRASLAATFMDDYVIVEKENGKAAWDYLEKNYDNVDIIMLDLLMPVMDGFQLLEKIRGNRDMAGLPVIITSQGDADIEHRVLEMKADDFVSKPYNTDIVQHRVANVVANYELKRIKRGGSIGDMETGDTTDTEKNKDQRILEMVKQLRPHFDAVRLVEPCQNLTYDEGDNVSCDRKACFSLWEKKTRCSNCISLEAYRKQTRLCKIEDTSEGRFFVLSEYVPYGKTGAVVEMITRITEEQ